MTGNEGLMFTTAKQNSKRERPYKKECLYFPIDTRFHNSMISGRVGAVAALRGVEVGSAWAGSIRELSGMMVPGRGLRCADVCIMQDP